MFESLYTRPWILAKHRNAPLAVEREKFLQHLANSGARQGSCHLIHAAKGCLSALRATVATTESRSGLSVTTPTGVQSRVSPDHRAGLRSRAVAYSA